MFETSTFSNPVLYILPPVLIQQCNIDWFIILILLTVLCCHIKELEPDLRTWSTIQFSSIHPAMFTKITLGFIDLHQGVSYCVFFPPIFCWKMFLNRGNLLQSVYYFFCLFYGIRNKKNWVIPAGTITVSVVNYCNLWWIYPSWYLFNTPVQAIIVLSKSRLKD